MHGATKSPGAVIEGKMRRRPAWIMRRAGMKIISAMAERLQEAAGNDDAGGEGDEPGLAQHPRLDRGKLVEREREAERQRGIMGPEQVAERALLMHRRGEKNDGLEHATADLALVGSHAAVAAEHSCRTSCVAERGERDGIDRQPASWRIDRDQEAALLMRGLVMLSVSRQPREDQPVLVKPHDIPSF